jgi:hypothetical protein
VSNPIFALPGIEIISIDAFSEFAETLPRQHKYFTLLLAWDAPEGDQTSFLGLFRPLVDKDLAYFCAWGLHCETLHDAVDMCVVEKELNTGEADHLLMTTWHENESLEEAFEFFSDLAIPGEPHVFEDFDRFAVTVRNPGWAVALRTLQSAQ